MLFSLANHNMTALEVLSAKELAFHCKQYPYYTARVASKLCARNEVYCLVIMLLTEIVNNLAMILNSSRIYTGEISTARDEISNSLQKSIRSKPLNTRKGYQ